MIFKTLVFMFVIVMGVEMKALESEQTSLKSVSPVANTKDQVYETLYADELKSVKLAVRLYAYYNELLHTNMFANQAQKKQATLNLQQVQTKLQNYMNKFKNNKYMISQPLTEYVNVLKQANFKNNNIQPVFTDEKKPFMWG